MNSDIKAILREFIQHEIARGRPFRDDESLIETGILSSSGIMDLVTFANETFQIEIDIEGGSDFVPENFETLEAITALVASKRGAA